MKEFTAGSLHVIISPTRSEMGARAGEHAARAIQSAVERNGAARIILASAPSQNETLAALLTAPVEWSKVTIFHMDEYLGLAADHPQTFRAYQRHNVLSKITPAAFHGIAGECADPAIECERYFALLREAPIDVCCLGIGENGHLAFNDPPVADFADTTLVKTVELDAECRQQQVNDGCFPSLQAVPTHAITLSIPALMSARELICSVPGPRKAAAVRATIRDEITTACPATILRRHRNAALYIDTDAAQDMIP